MTAWVQHWTRARQWAIVEDLGVWEVILKYIITILTLLRGGDFLVQVAGRPALDVEHWTVAQNNEDRTLSIPSRPVESHDPPKYSLRSVLDFLCCNGNRAF